MRKRKSGLAWIAALEPDTRTPDSSFDIVSYRPFEFAVMILPLAASTRWNGVQTNRVNRKYCDVPCLDRRWWIFNAGRVNQGPEEARTTLPS